MIYMENLNKKQKIIFVGMAVIMCITIGVYFAGVWKMPEEEIIEEKIEDTKEEQPANSSVPIVWIELGSIIVLSDTTSWNAAFLIVFTDFGILKCSIE